MSDETRKVTLGHPITYGERTWTDLDVRRPRAGDLRGCHIDFSAEEGGWRLRADADDLLRIAARISGLPLEKDGPVCLMDLLDLGNVIGEVLGFFGARPTSNSTTQ